MRKKFDVSPDVARHAYFLYNAKRWPPRRIAGWLNAEGVPGPSRRGAWGQEAVRRFIITPAERRPPQTLNEPIVLPKPLKISRRRL